MRNGEVVGDGSTGSPDRWWDDVEFDPVHIAAAEWRMRLQGSDVSDSEMSEWLDWMERDARHTAAFDRLAEVSSLVRRVRLRPTRDALLSTKDRDDASALLVTWRKGARPFRAAVAAAASVVLAVLLGGAMLFLADSRFPSLVSLFEGKPIEQAIETAVGENRVFMLKDGSRVTLGGRTHVRISFSKHERQVTLDRGEAYFQVAKEPARIFTVHVGSATAKALGTAFNVNRNRDGDRAVITVTEGRVAVELLPSRSKISPRREVLVKGGEQVLAGAATIGPPVAVHDLSSVISWQSGRLSFRQRPLRDAIADANRYALKQLILEGPEIGDIEITGTVSTSNIRGWITSLERAFDLAASEEPNRIVLRAASAD